jgi:hypothetical protein
MIDVSHAKFCLLAILLFGAGLAGDVPPAAAQSAKSLKGECVKLYKSWKTKPGNAAVAASRTGHCGLSYGYPTIAEARRVALAHCRKSGAKGCKVFDEKRRPKSLAQPTLPNLKGKSKAVTLKAFQARYGLSNDEMRKRFGAAGKVVCPFSSGTVFLLGRPNMFVTSDHIFIDMKNGKPRGNIAKCWVLFFQSKQRYAIKASSVVHGLKTNKTAYQFAWYDWMVGRLDRPVKDVVPLEPTAVVPGNDVTVSILSQGMNDSVPRVCVGLVTSAVGNYNLNEITTDCSTGPGASGGPVILGSLEPTPNLPLKVIALTWGTTSIDTETINHVGMPISDGELQKALRKVLAEGGQGAAGNAAQAVPAMFRLDLENVTEHGDSCKVAYTLSNQSTNDLSRISVSIGYTNVYGHPPVSETTKIEGAHAGKTAEFEQTVPMLCRRLNEVALNAISAATPEIDLSSMEALMRNVTLESHAPTVRMLKYNDAKGAGAH